MPRHCLPQLSVLLALFLYAGNVIGETTLAEELWHNEDSRSSCGGSYIVVPESSSDSPESTRLLADRVRIDLDGTGQVVGNVVIQRDGQTLEAPSLDLNTEERVFKTPHGAQIVSSDIAVRVARSSIEVESELVDIQDAEFVMLAEQYRGYADTLKASANSIELSGALITQCPPNNNSWSLMTNQLRVDRNENIAVARGVSLRLGRVPLLYVPYARFPIVQSRTSGLLLPEFENSSLLGFQLGLPVYFNLAPNYDLTLTPRLSTKRNHTMEIEFRHRNSQSNSKLVGIVLPSDHQYQKYVNRLLREPFTYTEGRKERWLLDANSDLLWNSWNADVAYSLVSDTDFYRDFGESSGDFNHVGLSRVLRISRIGRKFDLGILMERYDPFRQWGTHVAKLPQITLSGGHSLGPLKAAVKVDWTRMESHGTEASSEFDRSHGELSVSFPVRRTWGYSRLKVLRTFTRYQSSKYRLDDRETTTYLLDTGLWLERTRNDASVVSHQLEPRLVYARRAEVPQIGFPDWDTGPPSASIRTLVEPFRRAGIDRIGELNALSVSLVARFIDKTTQREKTRITTVLSIPSEGYGVEIENELGGELSVTGFHLIRPDRWTQEATGSSVRYSRDGIEFLGQIRYHQPDDLLQSFLSAKISLNEKWTIYGRWNYDWTYDRHVESYAGFERSGCCVAFRFLWRKSLRYGFADWEDLRARTGLHFELSLKGLTSFGDNIASIIERRVR